MQKQTQIKFPEGFLWGAATAAHQIEGNNTNSDWYKWEQSEKRTKELACQGKNPKDFQSGLACDSYYRYEEDFEIAKKLNHNAHRLSIEWARIEPEEGKFSEEEFKHYEKVLSCAKNKGLKIFLTLHHFTNPIWFSEMGGFTKKENVRYFVRFGQEVAKHLGDYVDFFITINEPEGYVSGSFINGVWPPQRHNIFTALKVAKNLALAHKLLVPLLKRITRKPVSMAYNIVDYKPTNLLANVLVKTIYFYLNKFVFYQTVELCDFIGVNYYFHHHIGILGKRRKSGSGHKVSDVGWSMHPEGLESILLGLKKYGKPIYITENGVADGKDSIRKEFIEKHLYHIHQAILKGANVKGYLHWSLLDNFEWEKGFEPRFGLVGIDYQNLRGRFVRPSALAYAEICQKNGFEYNN